jgi:general stress protein CsbA
LDLVNHRLYLFNGVLVLLFRSIAINRYIQLLFLYMQLIKFSAYINVYVYQVHYYVGFRIVWKLDIEVFIT